METGNEAILVSIDGVQRALLHVNYNYKRRCGSGGMGNPLDEIDRCWWVTFVREHSVRKRDRLIVTAWPMTSVTAPSRNSPASSSSRNLTPSTTPGAGWMNESKPIVVSQFLPNLISGCCSSSMFRFPSPHTLHFYFHWWQRERERKRKKEKERNVMSWDGRCRHSDS